MAAPDVSSTTPPPSSPMRKTWRRTSRSLSKMIEFAPAQEAFARVLSGTIGISCNPLLSRYTRWCSSPRSMTRRIRPELGDALREPTSVGEADGEIATDGRDEEDATTVGAGVDGELTVGLGPLE